VTIPTRLPCLASTTGSACNLSCFVFFLSRGVPNEGGGDREIGREWAGVAAKRKGG
jgi:hypothetical protein